MCNWTTTSAVTTTTTTAPVTFTPATTNFSANNVLELFLQLLLLLQLIIQY